MSRPTRVIRASIGTELVGRETDEHEYAGVQLEGIIDAAAFGTIGAAFDTAVTGGTGTYRGQRGQVHWTVVSSDSARGVFVAS